MKTETVVLAGGLGILGLLIASKLGQSQQQSESGQGSVLPGITMPDITMPGITMPDITMPGLTMPEIILGNIKLPGIEGSNIGLPQVEIPDIKLPQVEIPDIKIPGIDWSNLNPFNKDGQTENEDSLVERIKEALGIGGADAPAEGDKENTPTKEAGTQTVEGFSSDPWGDWVNQITGHQGVTAGLDKVLKVNNLLNTRTQEMLEGEGIEIHSGALPWQTPHGEGFIAPWSKVAYNPDTQKVMTAPQIQEVLRNWTKIPSEADNGRLSGSGKGAGEPVYSIPTQAKIDQDEYWS